jgi:hypothetical protein
MDARHPAAARTITAVDPEVQYALDLRIKVG